MSQNTDAYLFCGVWFDDEGYPWKKWDGDEKEKNAEPYPYDEDNEYEDDDYEPDADEDHDPDGLLSTLGRLLNQDFRGEGANERLKEHFGCEIEEIRHCCSGSPMYAIATASALACRGYPRKIGSLEIPEGSDAALKKVCELLELPWDEAKLGWWLASDADIE